jgi:hypothetical protein
MPDDTEQLKQFLGLLASLQLRPGHPGEDSYHESRWAAIMIRNLFGPRAVRPLASTLAFRETFDPGNRLVIRHAGFRDPETARRCKYRAIDEARWCLEQIDGSVGVLIADLGAEEATAACALGYLRSAAAVEPLADRLSDSNKEVAVVVSSALKKITGKSFWFGNRDPQKWRTWWNKKKDRVARRRRLSSESPRGISPFL